MDRTQWRPRLAVLAFVALGALGGCSGSSVVGGRLDGDVDGDAGDDIVDAEPDAKPDRPSPVDAEDGAAPLDREPPGDAGRQCTSNDQCSGNEFGQNLCDPLSGRCVACTVADDRCAVGEYCNAASNSCVRGCRTDEACRAGASDAGVADGGDAGASNGRCNVATHTCVDCVTDEHCGPGQRCVGNTCVTGCTEATRCAAGQTCCMGGCVDTAANTANCGACGAACITPNGEPRCEMGRCQVGECTGAFRDCDTTADNGCETNTLGDLTNCGGCGRVCPSPAGATATCAMGVCGITCNPGFADCDMNPENGCEVDTRVDATHCGGCATTCRPMGAVGACVMGRCAVATCDVGLGDCDGNAANGCETDVRASATSCGTCGTACLVPANGAATCEMGRCGVRCAEGFGDCDGNPLTGCEINTRTDTTHCGACGRPCVIPHGVPSCEAGACRVGRCNLDFADCDGDPANGCETDLRSTAANCGRCGNSCSVMGASAACAAGTCVIGGCAPGLGDCDSSDANGCETDITTSVTNCGVCAGSCVIAHGTPACTAGRCTVGRCDDGFGDCDGDPSNGCETDLRTSVGNCGRCGGGCAIANGTAACVAGTCTVGVCNLGFADCNASAADGCEVVVLTDISNCARCGNVCPTPPSGTPLCRVGVCGIGSCRSGTEDCDLAPGNGCEVNTATDVTNCGACGLRCPAPPNATADCTGGVCGIGTCNAGFADCDGLPANGCEVDLRSSAGNCGRCGNACSTANGTPACVASACGIGACNAGFANCDGVAANGCETDTRTSAGNCGRCANACAAPVGGSAACAASACTQVCPAGQTNCGGTCRPTGAACTSAGTGGCAQDGTVVCSGSGTACSAAPRTSGACTSPSGGTCDASGTCACAGGTTNCGGTCRNLTTDANNCGACGRGCAAPSGGTVSCGAGACVQACPAGQTNCGGVCRATGAACTSAGTGGCATSGAIVCSGSGTACSAAPRTSGACTTPPGGVCDGSANCVCPAGTTNCSGTCRDLASDTANCGACGRACGAASACVSGVCVGSGSLRFTLTWDVSGDMDLHVVPPCGSEIYYGSRTACGGTLDRDDTSARGPENVNWVGSFTPGRYYVCTEAYTSAVANANYVLSVVRAGVTVRTVTGRRGVTDGYRACGSGFNQLTIDL